MLSRFKNWTAALASALPPLLVCAVLAAVAYWGHRTEWGAKVPKFSALFGTADEAADDDDKPNGSPADAPTVTAAAGAPDWCAKHNVADSLCTDCHPELANAGTAAPPVESGIRPSHRPQDCRTHLEVIRFPTTEALRNSGVRTEPARVQALTDTITANGTVEYDPRQTVRVSPRAGGAVFRVFKHLGDPVRAGELLALIDAAEVGKAKAELLQAVVHLDTRSRVLQSLTQNSTAPERSLQEAEAAVRDARARLFTARQALLNLGLPLQGDEAKLSDEQLAKRLQFLGIPADVVAALQTDTATANLLPLTAPRGGTVIERRSENGETVGMQQTMFVISDVSTVHVHLDIRQEDAARLARGQGVRFKPDGVSRAASGEIHWIGTDVDETTRLVHVHAECDNPDGRLKANQFGTATITVGTHDKSVVVPAEAVQWEGCSFAVFVAPSELEFRPRKVRLGLRQDGVVEVLVGLKPGEVVATAGSHVLKSYLFRDRLGAAED